MGVGGTRHRPLSDPIEHPGQSLSAELKLSSQSPKVCSTHRVVSNTKLFPDLFERTLASLKGSSAPIWTIVSTAIASARLSHTTLVNMLAQSCEILQDGAANLHFCNMRIQRKVFTRFFPPTLQPSPSTYGFK